MDATPTDAQTPSARDASSEQPRWSSRRCEAAPVEQDARAWEGDSDGAACFVENTCGTSGPIQPGALCDDLDVCFDAPYDGPLPGRFVECEPYRDAPACCSFRGALNQEESHRRAVDAAAMDEICALTALGAHVQCIHWLN